MGLGLCRGQILGLWTVVGSRHTLDPKVDAFYSQSPQIYQNQYPGVCKPRDEYYATSFLRLAGMLIRLYDHFCPKSLLSAYYV